MGFFWSVQHVKTMQEKGDSAEQGGSMGQEKGEGKGSPCCQRDFLKISPHCGFDGKLCVRATALSI